MIGWILLTGCVGFYIVLIAAIIFGAWKDAQESRERFWRRERNR